MKSLPAAMLLLLVAVVALANGEDRQVVEGDVLKDLDYGFELKRPSSNWFFMKEKSIAKVNPDACAGLYVAGSKAFVMVIAEEAPETSLEDYAELLIDTMDVEKKEVLVKKALTIGNIEAYQYKVKCESEGAKLTYFSTIYKKDDFYFQVVCFWDAASGGIDPKDINAIFSSFAFTPGVKPRARTPESPEKMHGVGWRVEKNLYENAVYGFKSKLPSDGWRFMSKEELRDSNPEASLGAEHGRSGTYLLVIAENLGSMKAEEYEKLVLESFEAENPAVEHKKSSVKLGGKDVTEHVYEKVALGKVLMDFFLVVDTRGQVGCQVMAWCMHAKSNAAAKEMKSFYAGFSWLDDKEKGQLREQLIKLADCERSVSANECFRNRSYVDFQHGFSLSLPQGFWSHVIGSAAKADNEDVSLLLTNLDYELNGTLLLEEVEDLSAQEYHDGMLALLDTPSINRRQEAKEILELVNTDTDLDNLRNEEKFKEMAKAAKGEKDLPKQEPRKPVEQKEPGTRMTDLEREEAYEKALEHVDEGETDKALQVHRKILESFPDDLLANYWAACLLSVKKETDKALTHLENAVRTALAVIEKYKAVQTKTVKASGLDILSTRFSETEENGDVTYHLATASMGNIHATLLFSGLKSNLDKTQEMELEILKSIRLTGKPADKTVRLADGTYVDHRLGFKLTPPNAEFKVVDISWMKPEIAEVGTFIMMSDTKAALPPVLTVGALHSDVPDLAAFVTEIMSKSQPSENLKITAKPEETVTWLGQPARLLRIEAEAQGEKRQIEFCATSVGGTFYFVLLFADSPGVKPEVLRKCLDLIP